MIEKTCSQCGAPNPQQSKFCNRCGSAFFTDTTHICPTCDQPNPSTLLYCDNCGTRLVEDSAAEQGSDESGGDNGPKSGRSEPFSLPSRPPGQTGELDVSAHLPDWLRTGDFSGEQSPDDAEELPWLRSTQEDDSWSDGDAPTLEELSREHAPRDDLPTWLLEEETAHSLFTGEKTTDELFLSHLSDSKTGNPQQNEDDGQQDPPETENELEAWLAGLQAGAPEPLQDSGEAEGDDAGETPAPEPGPASELGEDDFLQWLSKIQQEAADEGAADGGEDAPLPSALTPPADQEHEDTSDERSDAADKDEFLLWLDSLDPTHEDAAQESAEQSADVDGKEYSGPPLATGASIDDDFELPDWLGDLVEPDEAPDAGVGDDEPLPEWLQDLSPSAGQVSLPYVSGAEVELNAGEPTEEDEQATADATTPGSAARAPQAEEEALPDWVRGVSAELDEAPQDGPEEGELAAGPEQAWGPDFAEDSVLESAAPALDAEAINREDLPDWFSDVLSEIKPGPEDEFAGVSQNLAYVPEQLAGAELPDWLDSPFADEVAAEPTPLEEIPEWLRAPLKERLARAAEERGIDHAELGGGEEWRELLEAPITAEESSPQPAADLVPGWLATLRSAVDLEAADTVADPLAGDEKGPVAEIPGALGIASAVAQASYGERSVAGAASQEQQVLLMRQLARMHQDDIRVAPPAVSGSSPLPFGARLLLALLLLAAIVAGLFIGADWGATAPASESSVAPLIEAIAPGDQTRPVLVVFDYPPATAGALDPMAQALLRALKANDVPLLLTSQSAQGLALANRSAARAELTDFADLGFIPGDAAGVRRFARCLQIASSCDSLFGQTIDGATAAQLNSTRSVVVITSERDKLLNWIEQLQRSSAISLVAVVTPDLQPVTLPYAASGQLAEVATVGSGTYDVGPGLGPASFLALNLAQWFIAAAMVVGSAYYSIIGMIRRRRV